MTNESVQQVSQQIKEGLLKGDPKVVRQLYQTAFPPCVQYIKNNKGTTDDAKDLFQESLMVLIRNIRKEEFKLGCHINTYLYSVVRNLWLKQLRDSKRGGLSLVIDEPEREYVVVQEEELEDKRVIEKKHELISEMLNTFKEDCKTFFKAFYFEKKSLAEIAKTMNFTPNYAKKKRHTCMETFKKQVRERFQSIQ